MRYTQLLCSVLTLCLMLTVNAYAATVDSDSPTDNIPEWALKPAIEPDEDTSTDTDTDTEQGYTTIYDTDGSILYTDDPALLSGDNVTAAVLPQTVDAGSLFLTKPFAEYTVTEGFLLLGFVMGFILLLWRLVKGVF